MATENRSVDERDTLPESRTTVTRKRPSAMRWFILIPLLVLTFGLVGYIGGAVVALLSPSCLHR